MEKFFLKSAKHNPNSHFIHNPEEIDLSLIDNITSIGICGATSTPKWQMEEVAKIVKKLKSDVHLID